MKAKRGFAWAASGYRTWRCLPDGVDIVVLQGRLPDPVARWILSRLVEIFDQEGVSS